MRNTALDGTEEAAVPDIGLVVVPVAITAAVAVHIWYIPY